MFYNEEVHTASCVFIFFSIIIIITICNFIGFEKEKYAFVAEVQCFLINWYANVLFFGLSALCIFFHYN